MRLIKLLSALGLVLTLAACSVPQGGEAQGDNRTASCVLESDDYTIRVVRGEKRLEFVSPESLSGVSVVFDDEGKCTLQTSGGATSGGTDDGAGADMVAGVSVPLQDKRGWLDWLVAAYPEDYLPEDQQSGVASGTFSLDGADFTIEDGSKCTIVRAGVSRSATRSDE